MMILIIHSKYDDDYAEENGYVAVNKIKPAQHSSQVRLTLWEAS